MASKISCHIWPRSTQMRPGDTRVYLLSIEPLGTKRRWNLNKKLLFQENTFEIVVCKNVCHICSGLLHLNFSWDTKARTKMADTSQTTYWPPLEIEAWTKMVDILQRIISKSFPWYDILRTYISKLENAHLPDFLDEVVHGVGLEVQLT